MNSFIGMKFIRMNRGGGGGSEGETMETEDGERLVVEEDDQDEGLVRAGVHAPGCEWIVSGVVVLGLIVYTIVSYFS